LTLIARIAVIRANRGRDQERSGEADGQGVVVPTVRRRGDRPAAAKAEGSAAGKVGWAGALGCWRSR
jgi:hypothetical protein